MTNKVLSVGVDDGHSETKIVLPNGKKFRIPSQATSGKVNVISINDDAQDVFGYDSPEGGYIAGNIQHADPTNFNEYPLSTLNRVIVTHALCQSGAVNGMDLKICTGLPLKRFYIKGKPNKGLIRSKIDNLLKNDVTPLDQEIEFKIVDHRVFSEGVASWVDYVVQRDDKGILQIDPEALKKRIAIIDIGGRTLDVAVVSDWKLDADRSGTFDIGMLAIRNQIIEDIYNDHEVELTEEQILQVLSNRTFKLYGKEMDASLYISEAEKQVVNSAKAQVMRLLGKAADIDEVLFVGGTSCYLEPYLKEWFPHQKMVKDAAFANARGFQKFMELTS